MPRSPLNWLLNIFSSLKAWAGAALRGCPGRRGLGNASLPSPGPGRAGRTHGRDRPGRSRSTTRSHRRPAYLGVAEQVQPNQTFGRRDNGLFA